MQLEAVLLGWVAGSRNWGVGAGRKEWGRGAKWSELLVEKCIPRQNSLKRDGREWRGDWGGRGRKMRGGGTSGCCWWWTNYVYLHVIMWCHLSQHVQPLLILPPPHPCQPLGLYIPVKDNVLVMAKYMIIGSATSQWALVSIRQLVGWVFGGWLIGRFAWDLFSFVLLYFARSKACIILLSVTLVSPNYNDFLWSEKKLYHLPSHLQHGPVRHVSKSKDFFWCEKISFINLISKLLTFSHPESVTPAAWSRISTSFEQRSA